MKLRPIQTRAVLLACSLLSFAIACGKDAPPDEDAMTTTPPAGSDKVGDMSQGDMEKMSDMGQAPDMMKGSLDMAIDMADSPSCAECEGVACYDACKTEETIWPEVGLTCDDVFRLEGELVIEEFYLDPDRLSDDYNFSADECAIEDRKDFALDWTSPVEGNYQFYLFAAERDEVEITDYGFILSDLQGKPMDPSCDQIDQITCSPNRDGGAPPGFLAELPANYPLRLVLEIVEPGFYLVVIRRRVTSCGELSDCEGDDVYCDIDPNGYAECYPENSSDNSNPGNSSSGNLAGLGEGCRDRECAPGLYCETLTICPADTVEPICVTPCSESSQCNDSNTACTKRRGDFAGCKDVSSVNDRKYCGWQ